MVAARHQASPPPLQGPWRASRLCLEDDRRGLPPAVPRPAVPVVALSSPVPVVGLATAQRCLRVSRVAMDRLGCPQSSQTLLCTVMPGSFLAYKEASAMLQLQRWLRSSDVRRRGRVQSTVAELPRHPQLRPHHCQHSAMMDHKQGFAGLRGVAGFWRLALRPRMRQCATASMPKAAAAPMMGKGSTCRSRLAMDVLCGASPGDAGAGGDGEGGGGGGGGDGGCLLYTSPSPRDAHES
eukprot:7387098-Prymnesium_polylepis.2